MQKLENTCLKCEKPALIGGLCRTHHIEAKEAEWLDNTDINNLGIVKWIHEMMPEFAYDVTPLFHKELFLDLLSLYNSEYRNKYERSYEFICFREGAKSTAANTLFLSYIIAHNGKKFKYKIDGEIREFTINEKTIVIISETAGSAEDFSVRIRDAFSSSERLRYYYQFVIQDAVDSITGQWTRSAFKINGTFVQAVGSGQQIRGKVKGVSRPTLVIADDIYSENNTITEERRDRIKRWWNNSVMNSIDNLLGKTIVLGTILHDDTIIVELEHNPQWRTKKIPVMPVDLFQEFIQAHTKVDWDTATCWIPFSDEMDRNKRLRKQKKYFDKVQQSKDWGLAWPERIDLYLLAIKWQEAVHNHSTSGMYQEYFHITTSPGDKKFRKEYFRTLQPWDLKYEMGYNWIKVLGQEKWEVCNIEFGIDLAGKGADDAVITVIASLPDMKIYVLHQAIGKWSIRDTIKSEASEHYRLNKVIVDRSQLETVGIVDEAFRLALRYNPSKIKIGTAAEEEMIVEEFRRVFQVNRRYQIQIQSRPQTRLEGKKTVRISGTLLPYYETRMVHHAPGLDKLEYQLEYLGKSTHDDCADSMECAVWQLEFPWKVSPTVLEKNTPSASDNSSESFPPHYVTPHETEFEKMWRWL